MVSEARFRKGQNSIKSCFAQLHHSSSSFLSEQSLLSAIPCHGHKKPISDAQIWVDIYDITTLQFQSVMPCMNAIIRQKYIIFLFLPALLLFLLFLYCLHFLLFQWEFFWKHSGRCSQRIRRPLQSPQTTLN